MGLAEQRDRPGFDPGPRVRDPLRRDHVELGSRMEGAERDGVGQRVPCGPHGGFDEGAMRRPNPLSQ
jgi:hypothetical protein